MTNYNTNRKRVLLSPSALPPVDFLDVKNTRQMSGYGEGAWKRTIEDNKERWVCTPNSIIPSTLFLTNNLEEDSDLTLEFTLEDIVFNKGVEEFEEDKVDEPVGLCFSYYDVTTSEITRRFMQTIGKKIIEVDQQKVYWPEKTIITGSGYELIPENYQQFYLLPALSVTGCKSCTVVFKLPDVIPKIGWSPSFQSGTYVDVPVWKPRGDAAQEFEIGFKLLNRSPAETFTPIIDKVNGDLFKFEVTSEGYMRLNAHGVQWQSPIPLPLGFYDVSIRLDSQIHIIVDGIFDITLEAINRKIFESGFYIGDKDGTQGLKNGKCVSDLRLTDYVDRDNSRFYNLTVETATISPSDTEIVTPSITLLPCEPPNGGSARMIGFDTMEYSYYGAFDPYMHEPEQSCAFTGSPPEELEIGETRVRGGRGCYYSSGAIGDQGRLDCRLMVYDTSWAPRGSQIISSDGHVSTRVTEVDTINKTLHFAECDNKVIQALQLPNVFTVIPPIKTTNWVPYFKTGENRSFSLNNRQLLTSLTVTGTIFIPSKPEVSWTLLDARNTLGKNDGLYLTIEPDFSFHGRGDDDWSEWNEVPVINGTIGGNWCLGINTFSITCRQSIYVDQEFSVGASIYTTTNGFTGQIHEINFIDNKYPENTQTYSCVLPLKFKPEEQFITSDTTNEETGKESKLVFVNFQPKDDWIPTLDYNTFFVNDYNEDQFEGGVNFVSFEEVRLALINNPEAPTSSLGPVLKVGSILMSLDGRLQLTCLAKDLATGFATFKTTWDPWSTPYFGKKDIINSFAYPSTFFLCPDKDDTPADKRFWGLNMMHYGNVHARDKGTHLSTDFDFIWAVKRPRIEGEFYLAAAPSEYRAFVFKEWGSEAELTIQPDLTFRGPGDKAWENDQDLPVINGVVGGRWQIGMNTFSLDLKIELLGWNASITLGPFAGQFRKVNLIDRDDLVNNSYSYDFTIKAENQPEDPVSFTPLENPSDRERILEAERFVQNQGWMPFWSKPTPEVAKPIPVWTPKFQTKNKTSIVLPTWTKAGGISEVSGSVFIDKAPIIGKRFTIVDQRTDQANPAGLYLTVEPDLTFFGEGNVGWESTNEVPIINGLTGGKWSLGHNTFTIKGKVASADTLSFGADKVDDSYSLEGQLYDLKVYDATTEDLKLDLPLKELAFIAPNATTVQELVQGVSIPVIGLDDANPWVPQLGKGKAYISNNSTAPFEKGIHIVSDTEVRMAKTGTPPSSIAWVVGLEILGANNVTLKCTDATTSDDYAVFEVVQGTVQQIKDNISYPNTFSVKAPAPPPRWVPNFQSVEKTRASWSSWTGTGNTTISFSVVIRDVPKERQTLLDARDSGVMSTGAYLTVEPDLTFFGEGNADWESAHELPIINGVAGGKWRVGYNTVSITCTADMSNNRKIWIGYSGDGGLDGQIYDFNMVGSDGAMVLSLPLSVNSETMPASASTVAGTLNGKPTVADLNMFGLTSPWVPLLKYGEGYLADKTDSNFQKGLYIDYASKVRIAKTAPDSGPNRTSFDPILKTTLVSERGAEIECSGYLASSEVYLFDMVSGTDEEIMSGFASPTVFSVLQPKIGMELKLAVSSNSVTSNSNYIDVTVASQDLWTAPSELSSKDTTNTTPSVFALLADKLEKTVNFTIESQVVVNGQLYPAKGKGSFIIQINGANDFDIISQTFDEENISISKGGNDTIVFSLREPTPPPLVKWTPYFSGDRTDYFEMTRWTADAPKITGEVFLYTIDSQWVQVIFDLRYSSDTQGLVLGVNQDSTPYVVTSLSEFPKINGIVNGNWKLGYNTFEIVGNRSLSLYPWSLGRANYSQGVNDYYNMKGQIINLRLEDMDNPANSRFYSLTKEAMWAPKETTILSEDEKSSGSFQGRELEWIPAAAPGRGYSMQKVKLLGDGTALLDVSGQSPLRIYGRPAMVFRADNGAEMRALHKTGSFMPCDKLKGTDEEIQDGFSYPRSFDYIEPTRIDTVVRVQLDTASVSTSELDFVEVSLLDWDEKFNYMFDTKPGTPAIAKYLYIHEYLEESPTIDIEIYYYRGGVEVGHTYGGFKLYADGFGGFTLEDLHIEGTDSGVTITQEGDVLKFVINYNPPPIPAWTPNYLENAYYSCRPILGSEGFTVTGKLYLFSIRPDLEQNIILARTARNSLDNPLDGFYLDVRKDLSFSGRGDPLWESWNEIPTINGVVGGNWKLGMNTFSATCKRVKSSFYFQVGRFYTESMPKAQLSEVQITNIAGTAVIQKHEDVLISEKRPTKTYIEEEIGRESMSLYNIDSSIAWLPYLRKDNQGYASSATQYDPNHGLDVIDGIGVKDDKVYFYTQGTEVQVPWELGLGVASTNGNVTLKCSSIVPNYAIFDLLTGDIEEAKTTLSFPFVFDLIPTPSSEKTRVTATLSADSATLANNIKVILDAPEFSYQTVFDNKVAIETKTLFSLWQGTSKAITVSVRSYEVFPDGTESDPNFGSFILNFDGLGSFSVSEVFFDPRGGVLSLVQTEKLLTFTLKAPQTPPSRKWTVNYRTDNSTYIQSLPLENHTNPFTVSGKLNILTPLTDELCVVLCNYIHLNAQLSARFRGLYLDVVQHSHVFTGQSSEEWQKRNELPVINGVPGGKWKLGMNTFSIGAKANAFTDITEPLIISFGYYSYNNFPSIPNCQLTDLKITAADGTVLQSIPSVLEGIYAPVEDSVLEVISGQALLIDSGDSPPSPSKPPWTPYLEGDNQGYLSDFSGKLVDSGPFFMSGVAFRGDDVVLNIDSTTPFRNSIGTRITSIDGIVDLVAKEVTEYEATYTLTSGTKEDVMNKISYPSTFNVIPPKGEADTDIFLKLSLQSLALPNTPAYSTIIAEAGGNTVTMSNRTSDLEGNLSFYPQLLLNVKNKDKEPKTITVKKKDRDASNSLTTFEGSFVVTPTQGGDFTISDVQLPPLFRTDFLRAGNTIIADIKPPLTPEETLAISLVVSPSSVYAGAESYTVVEITPPQGYGKRKTINNDPNDPNTTPVDFMSLPKVVAETITLQVSSYVVSGFARRRSSRTEGGSFKIVLDGLGGYTIADAESLAEMGFSVQKKGNDLEFIIMENHKWSLYSTAAGNTYFNTRPWKGWSKFAVACEVFLLAAPEAGKTSVVLRYPEDETNFPPLIINPDLSSTWTDSAEIGTLEINSVKNGPWRLGPNSVKIVNEKKVKRGGVFVVGSEGPGSSKGLTGNVQELNIFTYNLSSILSYMPVVYSAKQPKFTLFETPEGYDIPIESDNYSADPSKFWSPYLTFGKSHVANHSADGYVAGVKVEDPSTAIYLYRAGVPPMPEGAEVEVGFKAKSKKGLELGCTDTTSSDALKFSSSSVVEAIDYQREFGYPALFTIRDPSKANILFQLSEKSAARDEGNYTTIDITSPVAEGKVMRIENSRGNFNYNPHLFASIDSTFQGNIDFVATCVNYAPFLEGGKSEELVCHFTLSASGDGSVSLASDDFQKNNPLVSLEQSLDGDLVIFNIAPSKKPVEQSKWTPNYRFNVSTTLIFPPWSGEKMRIEGRLYVPDPLNDSLAGVVLVRQGPQHTHESDTFSLSLNSDGTIANLEDPYWQAWNEIPIINGVSGGTWKIGMNTFSMTCKKTIPDAGDIIFFVSSVMIGLNCQLSEIKITDVGANPTGPSLHYLGYLEGPSNDPPTSEIITSVSGEAPGLIINLHPNYPWVPYLTKDSQSFSSNYNDVFVDNYGTEMLFEGGVHVSVSGQTVGIVHSQGPRTPLASANFNSNIRLTADNGAVLYRSSSSPNDYDTISLFDVVSGSREDIIEGFSWPKVYSFTNELLH